MCSPDAAERSIHIIAHPRLILEYLSLRPCRRAAYIRRKSLLKKTNCPLPSPPWDLRECRLVCLVVVVSLRAGYTHTHTQLSPIQSATRRLAMLALRSALAVARRRALLARRRQLFRAGSRRCSGRAIVQAPRQLCFGLTQQDSSSSTRKKLGAQICSRLAAMARDVF